MRLVAALPGSSLVLVLPGRLSGTLGGSMGCDFLWRKEDPVLLPSFVVNLLLFVGEHTLPCVYLRKRLES